MAGGAIFASRSPIMRSDHTIRQWAEDDRPREKLAIKGRHALSDAELLAILLNSGSQRESAVEVGQRILREAGGRLSELGKYRLRDLTAFRGVGRAKAISVLAALELGNRRRAEKTLQRKKVTASEEVFEIFQGMLADLPHEEFWILLLNRANHIVDKHLISRGGISGTVADTRIIFKLAVEGLASSVILCHNHPSGNLKPSQADIDLTKRLAEAGHVMDIPVIDHLIVSDAGYYSFSDEGKL